MRVVRSTCPSCGPVDLYASEIELTIVPVDGSRVGPGSTYAFACPSCAALVTKPADDRIVELLVTAGVDPNLVRRDRHPAGRSTPHPEQPPDGPALTYDDLIDLHVLLRDPGWFDQLAALTA
ncbi:MAG TPA: hypothetical protein VHF25_00890 [Nitriliruptorales bacterium]|nr:hypothetical protein [Nitriliruptorales bacterium]